MRLLGILFILLSSSFNVYAQLPQVSAGSIERLTSYPSAFVPPRNIDIWLPADYDKQQRYAVLYMHDAEESPDDLQINHQIRVEAHLVA